MPFGVDVPVIDPAIDWLYEQGETAVNWAGEQLGLVDDPQIEEDARRDREALELAVRYGDAGLAGLDPRFNPALTPDYQFLASGPGVNVYEQADTSYRNAAMADAVGEGRAGQMRAAGYYDNLVSGGGEDAVSRAEYERERLMGLQQARAQRQGAEANLAERGLASGGLGLLAHLQAGQGAAQGAYMAGLQRAANAQARRDSAAASSADLYGDVRQGDWQSASAWAGAQDEINSGNTQRWQDAEYENVRRAQDVSDTNVGIANQQMDVERQAYDDFARAHFDQGRMVAGTLSGGVQAERAEDARQQTNYWNLLGAVARS